MRGCGSSNATAPPSASLSWTSALALAVLAQALHDARSPVVPSAIRDEATNFLVASDRLVLWAELLDVDLETVRAAAGRALRAEAPGRITRAPVRRGPRAPSVPPMVENPTSSPAPATPPRPPREWILSGFHAPGILSDNPLSID